MGNYYVPTNGVGSWREFLADSKKQWKPGYSAFELAYKWEAAENFPPSVKRVFEQSQIPLIQEVELLYGFPEYKVPLPGGSASSQNDLYVLAKANDELLTIMVEGKVSEPFGETVESWLGKEYSKGKKSRLDFLLEQLGLNEESVLDKRYQLLHRTASALIEAKQVRAKNAMMLVHSFSEAGKWFEDYEAFVKLFQLSPKKGEIVGPVLLDGVNLYFGWVTGKKSEVRDDNYYIKNTSNSHNQKVELWSTKRLQFEPKNWMKDMRNDLKNELKQITSTENGTLYAMFCTNDNKSWFDVENVLLYNVGVGAFSQIGDNNFIIEQSLENVPHLNNSPKFNHYHQYNYGKDFDLYWQKDDVLATWRDMKLSSLKDKPHEYWYQMKLSNIETYAKSLNKNSKFGLKLNIGVPIGKNVNLTSVCKPLIDGIVSSLHCYSGEDIDEVSKRLGVQLDIAESHIAEMLLEEYNAILGSHNVVRRFQKGIQWNPADDFCFQIAIKTFDSNETNFKINGEIYTLKSC
ncbi:DUF6946 family protein [Filobacillus milosensis]|uniref:DUF6946 family protein n=1 Tax=Filobacillus milosensis TaxID=94137 RepID=UPI001891C4AC|nr:hypothetical protein [Filobacillus milosensis]